jgi:hypothetical protein
MVAVREVDLSVFGIRIPDKKVGMVILQPFLQLGATEPFRLEESVRPRQLLALRRTLEIARMPDHGEERTSFTVIPEYSIPGLEGVETITSTMLTSQWPLNTIVMGGIDGLTVDEYSDLCAQSNTTVDIANRPSTVQGSEWINCLVLWVKAQDGSVHKWVQPKLSPAWIEQGCSYQHMYRGKSVFLFKCNFENGVRCRFLALLCFDWVGANSDGPVMPQVLSAINDLAGEDQVHLHWIFVLQNNPAPSHHTFLTRINNVLVQQDSFPKVRRGEACVLFGNTAGSELPGASAAYGASALVFSPVAPMSIVDTCHPTYSGRSERYRKTKTISTCRDSLLREGGACIHSLSHNVPAFMSTDAANRASSLERASVHPWLANALNDPRVPSGPVPCTVKWVNDALDKVDVVHHPNVASELAAAAPPAHAANVSAIRRGSGPGLFHCVDCATCSKDESFKDPDFWDSPQKEALETLMNTLDIIRIGYAPINVLGESSHCNFSSETGPVDVVVVRGESHEEFEDHVLKRVFPKARHRLLLVTRDKNNRQRRKRDHKITQVSGSTGEGVKITEQAIIRLGFADVQDCFEAATTIAEARGALDAKLVA